MSKNEKKVVNIPYYMPVAWEYMFAGTDKYDYRIPDERDSVLRCVQQYSCAKYFGVLFSEEVKHPDLRVIVLDDEFVDWMDKHHYEKTEENVEKYLNQRRSDKEAFRLIKKNGLDKDYFYMAIPIIVINQNSANKETRYILSAETINALHDHLQSVYEKCDICVARQMFKMKGFKKNKQVFDEIVDKYFKENVILMKAEMFSQEWGESESNMYAMFVPFALEYTHISPVFGFDNIYKENPFHPEYVGLEKFMTETEGLDYVDVATINEEIDGMIQKDLSSDKKLILVDYDLKSFDEIPRYYRNMRNVWEVSNA